MPTIVVIAHNIRSTHNVGSLLRTAEGLGISEVILTGYTPYPLRMIDGSLPYSQRPNKQGLPNPQYTYDDRLPHESRKIHAQIRKTALGAEESQAWRYQEDVEAVLASLTSAGFIVAGLEQSDHSVPLPGYAAPDKIALLLGSEVTGIDAGLLNRCQFTLEIPMFGSKESFNVVQAAAMALYQLVFK